MDGPGDDTITGVFLFNGLVYLSLEYTTSTNAALINGATPILTILLAAAVGFDRLTGRRGAGALVSLVGVVWIVSRGSLGALLGLSFNRGDVVMLVAAVMWAIYTVFVIRVTPSCRRWRSRRLRPFSPCRSSPWSGDTSSRRNPSAR